MKRKILSLILVIILFSSACFCGCGRTKEPFSQTGFYFDTVITITLYDTKTLSAKRSQELLTACFSLCDTYEAMLSRTKEGSDIWRINHAASAPVEVHPETATLLKKALSFCQDTDGLLDISIAPVTDLWDFSSQHVLKQQNNASADPIPDFETLTERLSHVDYRKIQIDGNTVTLTDPLAAIDLGCAAKGYIADRLKEYLLSEGITSALINLGGNIQTIGKKPDFSPFQLGIQKPFGDKTSPAAVLSVSDLSLVSSGVYERYFETESGLYHHLLNAHTGFPENNGLLSVSVLTASSADADLLSTAAFLLGPVKGMAYIEDLPDTEAVFITKDGQLHATSGLENVLQIP